MSDTVEFFGETFPLNDSISEFALLEFAEAAAAGQDDETLEGVASIFRFVKECIAPEELQRFLSVARRNRANADALRMIIDAMFGLNVERPTERPSDSSDGPNVTELKFDANFDAKGSLTASRYANRPDLQLFLSRIPA